MDINAFLTNEDILSSRDFIKLISNQKEKDNIKSVRFVLPKIGRVNDFGHFKVSFKSPYYTSLK